MPPTVPEPITEEDWAALRLLSKRLTQECGETVDFGMAYHPMSAAPCLIDLSARGAGRCVSLRCLASAEAGSWHQAITHLQAYFR